MTPFTSLTTVCLAAVCLIDSVLQSSCQAATIRLTNRNFEHDTQAATGQTTGVWLIRFCDAGAPSCTGTNNLEGWQRLANDLRENAHILCADVDTVESDKVALRFGEAITSLPFYILLRNQKMYIPPSTVTTSYDKLYDWTVDGWRDGPGLAVPLEIVDTFIPTAKVNDLLNHAVKNVQSWFTGRLSIAQSGSVREQLIARAQLLLPLLLASSLLFLILLVAKSSRSRREGEGENESFNKVKSN